jgi:Mg2+ and Co2+ transporter CorA
MSPFASPTLGRELPVSSTAQIDPTAAGLPRSIFVVEEDPRREAREAVNAILSDSFMAFLSLLLIPIIVLPFFVNLPAWINQLFDSADLTIILFFVVEYAAKLYLAYDRWAYFRSPWHLLDLAVILLSFVSYVPLFGLSGKGSAILLVRLLRLPRAFAVAGRTAGSRLGEVPADTAPPEVEVDTEIHQVDPKHPADPHTLDWRQLEEHLGTPDPEWIHISNFSDRALQQLGAILRLPVHHLRLQQLDDLWPHVGRIERAVIVFVQSGEIQYPKRTREFYTIARRGAIIILLGPKVVSISPHGMDPFPRVEQTLAQATDTAPPFRLRVVEGLLDATLRDYRQLLSDVDLEVSAIGRMPRSRLPKDFLARAYELQKSISRLHSNMIHFRELMGRFVSGRVVVDDVTEADKAQLEGLSDEATYLADLATESGESLQTVIDVYVNQSSFETNRILKILAVITAVALIPATIGGLLGIDGPYDFVLWQILLIVTLGMVFVTYCFLKLGWLRA